MSRWWFTFKNRELLRAMTGVSDNSRKEKSYLLIEDKVGQIQDAFDSGIVNSVFVKNLVVGLHASEIAQIIQYIDYSYREALITLLKPFDPEVFLFLDEHLREELIAVLSSKEIAAIVEVMESDDALSILLDLDEEQQRKILAKLPKTVGNSLERKLRYPPESAGRLMQNEVLALPQSWTIKASLEYIANEGSLPSNFHDVFVVDEENRPVGVLSLSKLVKSVKKDLLQDVMTGSVRTIKAQLNQEEVAFLFRSYDLMSAPVVDADGKIVGMITIDDVVDIIERRAEEEIMHMGRITTSDFYIPVFRTSLIRIQWLIVAFVDAILSSVVIDQFQSTFEGRAALTVLMPIAAAMGGNSGIQSVTVTVRALATRELSSLNMWRFAVKELAVSMLNGSVFAVVIGLISFIWFHELLISVVLSSAVVFSMCWAGFAGTFLPIFIEKLGYDSALSSGPLLSMTTDILGFTSFLWLAQVLIL
ncbi:magnesium transporter [Candidatus Hydrogenosomobacter endosymbioticus]|nr:magnesium transporter [Candidatus Hydrogenosomobacter endosymbioticus]